MVCTLKVGGTTANIFRRAAPERYTITSKIPLSLDGSTFDAAKTTFFLTHGYLNSGNETWMADLKDAILSKVRITCHFKKNIPRFI